MTPFRPTLGKAAFLAALLAVGLPYWSVPLSKLSLPDDILGFGLVLVLALAAWLAFSREAGLLKTVLAAGGVPAVVVLLRVVVEVAQNSTTHNLWPFEVGIAIAVGAPVAIVGAVLGKLLRRALRSKLQ